MSSSKITKTLGASESSTPPTTSGVEPTKASSSSFLGRYEVIKTLGSGGFGQVLLGRDSQLDRLVAIKLPNADRFKKPNLFASILAEAKMAANLRHEGIVTVFDVCWDDNVPYIVMEYVQGRTLSDFMSAETWTQEFAAQLMLNIALALHHAHEKGFIHRDLKPRNILLDSDDKPRIADFGLAVHQRDLVTEANRIVGTTFYMAPEQATGENHRIDRRTDIWALGVVLYQLLCRKRPFIGDSDRDLIPKIIRAEFARPRMIAPEVSEELERICVRCLSRQMSQRYRDANELADDLALWLEGRQGKSKSRSRLLSDSGIDSSSAPPDAIAMISRGLRPFKGEDIAFFPRLLPGPHDRNGLPLSITFWVSILAESDKSAAVPVGLLYGPSGSGKSSFVRAGLVPLLDPHVETVFVDATTQKLVESIERSLCDRFTLPSDSMPLADILAELRQSFEQAVKEGRPRRKLVIFFDQFEQWLATDQLSIEHPLVQALRQCDGVYVQCLLIVRDDFWRAISRFMALLEVGIIDGENAMLLDSFDFDHAKKVLHEIGRSLSCLPMNDAELTEAQIQFVDGAVTELSESGRLYPVRLAIFAELVRKQPWNLETLQLLGGASGVATSYLDHAIGPFATAARQVHRDAATKVLARLLPLDGDIKRSVVRRDDLLEVSGYKETPRDFELLMRLLDSELRLLTPVLIGDGPNPADTLESSDSLPTDTHIVAYRLTHDYLVDAIRKWIERDLLSQRLGRQQLLFRKQAALWSEHQSSKFLPTFAEYISFRLSIDQKDWTPPQREMMTIAKRRIRRAAAAIASAFVVVIVSAGLASRHMNRKAMREEAERLLTQLESPQVKDLDGKLKRLAELSEFSFAPALSRFKDLDQPASYRLKTGLLAVHHDNSLADDVVHLLLESNVASDQFAVACRILQSQRDAVVRSLEVIALKQSETDRNFINWCAVMAQSNPGHPELKRREENLTASLLRLPPDDALAMLELLEPLKGSIEKKLLAEFATEQDYRSATITVGGLFHFADSTADLFRRLLATANGPQFRAILQSSKQSRTQSLNWLAPYAPAVNTSNSNHVTIANFAIASALLGDIHPLSQIARDKTSPLRTKTMLMIDPDRIDFSQLLEIAEKADQDPPLLSLCLLATDRFFEQFTTSAQRQRLFALLDIAIQNPLDAELHAVANRMIEHWQFDAPELTKTSHPTRKDTDARWFVDPLNQSMIVLDIPATSQHPAYRMALGMTEVPIECLRAFEKSISKKYSPGVPPLSPIHALPLDATTTLCNWMSAKADIPEEQWCYEHHDSGSYAETLPVADFITRAGYRLPTTEEWQKAASGDSRNWLEGCDEKAIDRFVWSRSTARLLYRPIATKLPNPHGFFDIYGNVSELAFDLKAETLPFSEDQYVLLGGNVLSFEERLLRGQVKESFHPRVTDTFAGLRVARTLETLPSKRPSEDGQSKN